MGTAQIEIFIFLIGAGGFFLWSAIKNQKTSRKIQDTPRSKIFSAPQGHIEVQGFAWPKDGCVMNSHGSEVVYHNFKLQREESRGSGKNRRKVWVTIFEAGSKAPFYLVDATGLAIIHSEQAQVELSQSRTTMWKKLTKEKQEHVLNFIIKTPLTGFPPSTFLWGLFSSRFRIVEEEICVGSPLYVSGDFSTSHSEAEKIQALGLTYFFDRLVDPEKREFKNVNSILDKNGDGKVSEKEARDGYCALAKLSRQKSNVETSEEKFFEIYGEMTANGNHKLVIGDAHEHHLVDRLNYFFIPKIIGGAACLTAGLVIMGLNLNPINQENLKSRKLASYKKQVSSVELHQGCLDGVADKCIALLNNQTAYNLTSQHVSYYSYKACQLGQKQYCSQH